MYNYKMAVRQDLVNAMNEDRNQIVDLDEEDLREYLIDTFTVDDAVTGNASGSYTCNRWQAKEYVLGDEHSFEYLADAEAEGWITEEALGHWILEANWEAIDVTIRCYLLPEVVDDLIEKEWF